ncbi:hypothetical protein EDD86DRAFT_249296 [Gorgonomyces haynaldii]|nr:hypothetical protein EDD86DRAFT_249296 [Gorgonomyces haynaldii]
MCLPFLDGSPCNVIYSIDRPLRYFVVIAQVTVSLITLSALIYIQIRNICGIALVFSYAYSYWDTPAWVAWLNYWTSALLMNGGCILNMQIFKYFTSLSSFWTSRRLLYLQIGFLVFHFVTFSGYYLRLGWVGVYAPDFVVFLEKALFPFNVICSFLYDIYQSVVLSWVLYSHHKLSWL